MILVGGENLIDFIQVKSTRMPPKFQAIPGGAPYNCAKAIGIQGESVGYITPISTDTMGDLLEQELIRCGVNYCGPRREEPSSLALVTLSNGQPNYQFYRENTADRMVTIDELNKNTPTNTKAFYLGGLAISGGKDAEVWASYFLSLKKKNIFTALDPNIRPDHILDTECYKARLSKLLKAADLIKLSDDDLAWLFPNLDTNKAAQKLHKQFSASMVVITLGSEGAFALWDTNRLQVPAAPVKKLEDTVGAGDTFMATLLAGLNRTNKLASQSLKNLSKPEVDHLLKTSATAASLNCEQSGCNPPTLQEIIEQQITPL